MAVIEDLIRTVVAEVCGVDESEATPSANLADDLGADSLHIVEIVMRIEGEFGIEIPDEDFEKLTTVKALIEYIQGRVVVGE